MGISERALRTVRATVFTALVVMLSVASHVLLSRTPLPLATVAIIAAVVFAVAYPLAGRERGYGQIAALLIPLELAADTVFTAGQHVCYGRAGGPVAGPLRSVGLDVLCGGGDVGSPLAQVAGGDTGRAAALLAHADPATAWLLLGAHVGVGLLAAAWLRRGERALAQLLRAVAACTFRPLLIAVAAVTAHSAPGHRRARPAHRVGTALTRLLVHSVGRRGPPRSPAFA
ncbi:hypothetical protein H1V43_01660 [Streptomyces sp. PSKA54]|uniref:Integral membrane protein n=1 Tax=Streptomyces himalayensis subsp. aureolus TaxID=2758039 RepID=A0A7W2HDS3_9ACTN|nr:hypothetical protein [Streptomyces himalayensis]MBA4860102.1 hypothetical protein [Streptomyces himalayensis subsp. aureolus]